MPLHNAEEYGTNADGSQNADYCVYCYKDGAFTKECTMDEMIEYSAGYAEMAGMTKEEALVYAKEVFPTLKRWKSKIAED